MKKFLNPINLQKIVPNYFNVYVFRLVIAACIVLMFYTAYTNDWTFNFSCVECSPDSPMNCKFYYDNEYIELYPSEKFGSCPNHLADEFNAITISLLFAGFVLNHLVYILRFKRFKPEVNKKEWNKIKEIWRRLD